MDQITLRSDPRPEETAETAKIAETIDRKK
jgi:hypothetical protein